MLQLPNFNFFYSEKNSSNATLTSNLLLICIWSLSFVLPNYNVFFKSNIFIYTYLGLFGVLCFYIYSNEMNDKWILRFIFLTHLLIVICTPRLIQNNINWYLSVRSNYILLDLITYGFYNPQTPYWPTPSFNGFYLLMVNIIYINPSSLMNNNLPLLYPIIYHIFLSIIVEHFITLILQILNPKSFSTNIMSHKLIFIYKVIFFNSYWVSQDYLSPQSFGLIILYLYTFISVFSLLNINDQKISYIKTIIIISMMTGYILFFTHILTLAAYFMHFIFTISVFPLLYKSKFKNLLLSNNQNFDNRKILIITISFISLSIIFGLVIYLLITGNNFVNLNLENLFNISIIFETNLFNRLDSINSSNRLISVYSKIIITLIFLIPSILYFIYLIYMHLRKQNSVYTKKLIFILLSLNIYGLISFVYNYTFEMFLRVYLMILPGIILSYFILNFPVKLSFDNQLIRFLKILFLIIILTTSYTAHNSNDNIQNFSADDNACIDYLIDFFEKFNITEIKYIRTGALSSTFERILISNNISISDESAMVITIFSKTDSQTSSIITDPTEFQFNQSQYIENKISIINKYNLDMIYNNPNNEIYFINLMY